ncbi:ATP-dependent DNA helicase [Clostridium baratii]
MNIKKKLTEEERDDIVGDRDLKSIAEGKVHSFINGIASRYNLSLSPRTKVKGKEFVDDLLDNISSVKFRNDNSEEEEEVANSSSSKDLFKEIENLKKMISLNPYALSPDLVNIPLLKDYLKYAILVIGEVTGIGLEDIVSNHNSCQIYNELDTVVWFWCLIRNPYLCGLLGSGLNIVDCDKIFCGFSEGYDEEEITKYRDMLLVLDKIKNASSRSTLVNKRRLLSPTDNYPALGRRYLEDNGAPFSKNCLIAVSIMKDDIIEVDKSSVGLSSDIEEVLKDLNELGIIEEVNDGVILSSDLYKEYIIYSTLIEKGEDPTGVTDEDIEETIGLFEKSRGFKLEKLQKDGINLTKYRAGVLSGCAGSGKTTTSDCMVDVIKTFLPGYELKFGAPTGKAARRLAEVVGGNVKTIHSMFGLGLGSDPYIVGRSRNHKKNTEGCNYAYILDEMAMSNSNLMYDIVKNLGKEDLVYFLGDIKQLSPIGKGSPFRSLMHFLPCVELGVSKRAAENGKINYNCGLINFVSDDYIVELQEGEDFIIKPCADADVQVETVNMFKDMLNRFDEDDIQVVTGYQTDKYPWSTVQLNPLLQNLLRKPTDLLYVYNDQKFMRNDRVIHVKRNAYDMPRFRMSGSGSVFEEVPTFGIVNGELGKIVGYVKSTECTIFKWGDVEYSEEEWNKLDPDLKALIEKRKNTSVEIRDESNYKDENMYFVIVQIYDVDLKEDVVVLYHANFKEGLSVDFYSKTFVGGDLKYLDLAYALTTHKMQGSQSKAVIIPLGSSCSSNFMNRNMLNTMITRASDQVALIGSVRGNNSALTNGRRVTNIEEGEDVLGLLAE